MSFPHNMDQNMPDSLSRRPTSSMSTVRSRRRPNTPPLSLIFPTAYPFQLDPVTPPPRLESYDHSIDYMATIRPRKPFTDPPRRISSRHTGPRLPSVPFRLGPAVPLHSATPSSLDVTVVQSLHDDEMNMNILTLFPPTPSPSIHTPNRKASVDKLLPTLSISTDHRVKIADRRDTMESLPGPSMPRKELPPTPPEAEEEGQEGEAFNTSSASASTSVAFSEPQLPPRPQRRRRPASGYPQPMARASTSHDSLDSALADNRLSSQHLDVDLDSYSTTEYDTEDDVLEDCEPTLSFRTASTTDSTHYTPSSVGASKGHRPAEGEPRIRLRTNTGRSTAYSSAESSMASGAYSYSAYADGSLYHPHPPPMPSVPRQTKNEQIGLGFSMPDLAIPTFQAESSPSVADPNSPAGSFAHRPWRRDPASQRMRSDSASSAVDYDSELNQSANTPPVDLAVDGIDFPDMPWANKEDLASDAVALVEDGKSRVIDKTRIAGLGGVESLEGDVLASLAGTTHLLLDNIGSNLEQVLPALLSVVASTLVVLDISANGLPLLPETLRHCTLLEELNVSGNPIRVLPTWMAELVEMRVLAVDGCQLQSIPQDLSALGRLHTLCLRGNRLVSLPSWLCLLSHLETLRVDENPFAPEWLPIVSPILTSSSATMPARAIPPRSSSVQRRPTYARSRSSSAAISLNSSSEDGQSPLAQATSSLNLDSINENAPRSAPPPSSNDIVPHSANPLSASPSSPEKMSTILESPRGLRKMKSASDLLAGLDNAGPSKPSVRGPSHDLQSSAGINHSDSVFARSLGAKEGARIGASILPNYEGSTSPSKQPRPSTSSSATGKSGKWGFLRKMSKHRLRGDKDSSPRSSDGNVSPVPPLIHAHSDMGPRSPQSARPSFSTAQSSLTLPLHRNAMSEFGSLPSTPSVASIAAVPHTLPATSHGSNSLPRAVKRRSYLMVDQAPSLSVNIPSWSPFFVDHSTFEHPSPNPPNQIDLSTPDPQLSGQGTGLFPSQTLRSEPFQNGLGSPVQLNPEARYAQGLESIKSYLRDLFDLSRTPIEPYGSFEVVQTVEHGHESPDTSSAGLSRESRSSIADARRTRRPTMDVNSLAGAEGSLTASSASVVSCETAESGVLTGKKFKNDAAKRARVLREIWETERTYVRGLGELVTIYVKPSSHPVNAGKSNETIIPAPERKVVFGGIESILSIHRDNLLPALEKAIRPLLEGKDDEDGDLSTTTAHAVGEVFRTYIAYMKQYSSYINNFDNAQSRMKTWSAPSSVPTTPSYPSRPSLGRSSTAHTGSVSSAAISVGMGLSSLSLPLAEAMPSTGNQMSSSQKKRVKAFLKKCREHPLHSQINLESYLLLPIQRVPRYKLLLEDLAMCTMPQADGPRDTLDDALNEIASLASLMNEEKRDADSRLRLLHWQKRITMRGPSPLVQPHRRLIMDGALTLIRLVKKASSFVEMDTTVANFSVSCKADIEQTITPSKVVVPVEHITPEPMDRPIMLILCSDLLALVQQRTAAGGWDGPVDLFNVLRMGTLREPASIVHGNVLRVVDNKSIYYFNGESPEMILQWSRAINSARRR
ncbi:RhoGEF domain-domain-containing protein [Kockovaella imperatae]|uniref:RhoGEF domain-domain-containing protein n=1 Tax=Kockovaella imperatae TaxID=4999 RepID=A0A1Y1UH03_9TREE|nr:RhoGEF domain-domain-containing protein [Kockovaella imperatae]ORX37331.1 RhoGEF domain-domain-containing protein [Kockovaella imperatae]